MLLARLCDAAEGQTSATPRFLVRDAVSHCLLGRQLEMCGKFPLQILINATAAYQSQNPVHEPTERLPYLWHGHMTVARLLWQVHMKEGSDRGVRLAPCRRPRTFRSSRSYCVPI